MASTRRKSKGPRWLRRIIRGFGLALLLWVFSHFVAPHLSSSDAVAWRVDNNNISASVVSWNLRNFNGLDWRQIALDHGHPSSHDDHGQQTHDLARVRATIDELDATWMVFQEIRSSEALVELLPNYEVWTSKKGGHGGQKLGFARHKRAPAWLAAPQEHHELAMGGRVRPAISVTVNLPDNTPLRIIGVHLKATPSGLELRRKQWRELAKLIGHLDHERPKVDSLLVVGDFNVTGDHTTSPEQEQRELARVLAPTGLRMLPARGGCSAYWDGKKRDAIKEPSQLDFVWIRGLDRFIGVDQEALPMGACARSGCSTVRSTTANPDMDLAFVSDHCPMMIGLAKQDSRTTANVAQ